MAKTQTSKFPSRSFYFQWLNPGSILSMVLQWTALNILVFDPGRLFLLHPDHAPFLPLFLLLPSRVTGLDKDQMLSHMTAVTYIQYLPILYDLSAPLVISQLFHLVLEQWGFQNHGNAMQLMIYSSNIEENGQHTQLIRIFY